MGDSIRVNICTPKLITEKRFIKFLKKTQNLKKCIQFQTITKTGTQGG